MDKVFIYISYDQYEYTNYFHLAINDDIVIEYLPDEKVNDLFQMIIEKEGMVNRFELYVVQDENASEWDYLSSFQEHSFEIHPINNQNHEQLCKVMNSLFDGEYGISGKDDNLNKKLVSVLCSGNCILQGDNCETEETLRQEEEILKCGEEMTELARIIKEKYERMNRRE